MVRSAARTGTAILGLLALIGCDAIGDPSPTLSPRPPATEPEGFSSPAASATPIVSPSPSPRPIVDPFYPSIVLVQGENEEGFANIADGDGAIMLGHHYSAFGAACSEPTGVGERLAWAGDVPKMLYAAIAPTDLDWNRDGCAGGRSRLRDDAIEEFARRNLEVANADPSITHMNFWNELKGYAVPDDLGIYTDHYIRWASAIKAERPDLMLGGPYTHGGLSDEQLIAAHTAFIERVVIPHPDLVDFIASGDAERPSTFYTDIYRERGITLRHWQPEWYPGGHDAPQTPTVGAMVDELLTVASDPLMEGVMAWGSGPLESDTNQVVPFWDSDGNPTEYWSAYVEAAAFTALGSVEPAGDRTYRNGAGQTLSIADGGVSITGP